MIAFFEWKGNEVVLCGGFFYILIFLLFSCFQVNAQGTRYI